MSRGTGWMRNFDTLAGRTVLVVLLGIGIFHTASIWTYQRLLSREVTALNETRLADRLIAIKRAVMHVPPNEREAVAHELSGGPIEAHWAPERYAVEGGPGSEKWAELGIRLQSLAPELSANSVVVGSNSAGEDQHLSLISMQLPDNSWVNVTLVSWSPAPPAPHGAIVSTSLMALGAFLVSLLLVRWLTRPLRELAAAARAFYAIPAQTLVKEKGPREIRALAVAFNEMRQRIQRLVEDRTQALAAVSHDLKTPITRLRLRAEEISNAQVRDSIAADLDDMERMLDQTLAFLRGARADEPVKPVDLGAILQSLVADMADAGKHVSIEGEPDAVVAGRRLALKRAFSNLLDNAVKYGGCAHLNVDANANGVSISIADTGPGIAVADLERVMQPYVRLEPSRNAQTGGFGLGLTIAKAIIEGHGGSLVLQNRPGGGLTAIVGLPRGGANVT